MHKSPASTQCTIAFISWVASSAALYSWQVHGVEQAGSLFVFWMWFLAILQCVTAYLVLRYEPPSLSRRIAVVARIDLVIHLFFTAALVWVGYVVLPFIFLLSLVLWGAARAGYDNQGERKEPSHA